MQRIDIDYAIEKAHIPTDYNITFFRWRGLSVVKTSQLIS